MQIRGAIPTVGLSDGVVTVRDGIFTEVEAGPADTSPPDSGAVLLPGLLDIHCHGGGGASFATLDAAEATAAAAHHAARGTTRVMASLVTAEPADLVRQVRVLAPLVADGTLLGIHLEGPFLSPARRGAHEPSLLRGPDPALLADLLDAARGASNGGASNGGASNGTNGGAGAEAGGGAIKVVTMAPELPGAAAAASLLRTAGVLVAYGHTDADYAEMAKALTGAHGGALVTHLGNAMPPLHHRAAGPIAAALVAAAADRASVELIADGVHVDTGFTALVFAAAAPGRVVLVTDAMAAAGMADGEYQLGPLAVTVSGGVARLAGPDGNGSIAGGTSSLIEVVAHAAAAPGVGLPVAARAASEAPARILGLAVPGPDGPGRGAIEVGMAADLVVTGPDLVVRRVMRAGRWLTS
jgi:N-acetylglucosamine-6-phosphate deacetylase